MRGTDAVRPDAGGRGGLHRGAQGRASPAPAGSAVGPAGCGRPALGESGGRPPLAIDRRALLVSALAYVLFALNELFEQFGAVSLNIALTALVIGSALLLLSDFWHQARAAVVGRLPGSLRGHLPSLSPQPA